MRLPSSWKTSYDCPCPGGYVHAQVGWNWLPVLLLTDNRWVVGPYKGGLLFGDPRFRDSK